MGDCVYCHKSAGLLHHKHKECETRHDAGTKRIVALGQEAMKNNGDLAALDEQARKVASISYIEERTIPNLMVNAWEAAVEGVLEDDILSPQEESSLIIAMKHFGWNQDDLNKNGAYSKLAKAGVLRDVLEGKFSTRLKVEGQLPFNFQQGEQLIWVFPNVQYYELRSRRTYVGGYQGVSIRVMRGVYYRTGGFRGNPVDTTEVALAGTGAFAITDKHLYFSGGAKAFRIPYKKIVSFTPYSDGIGIQRDATTAKPQTFVTGDGWFTYNLIVNLANLQAGRIPISKGGDSPEAPTEAAEELFDLPVVGESHYQEALEAICGKRSDEGEDRVVDASLIPEDSNPHDSQAVRVDIQGRTVGYLSRDDARRFRQHLAQTGDTRGPVTCKARIQGGWDRGPSDQGSYGVSLSYSL